MMADIEIRRPVLQAQIRWVFRTTLGSSVVQLDAIKRVAEGIKTIEHYATRHSQLDRCLQTMVRSGLIGLREENCAKRASGSSARGDAAVVDGPACSDITRGAGSAGRCQRAGGGGIDVLGEGQIVAQSPHVSRRHAEIRGDLVLNGQIQLITVRPLEILRETEEWATRSDELWGNEWKWINTGNALGCAGRTNYGRA